MTTHIKVTGLVQGVGFRQFISDLAKQLDLAGWVKNMPDGSVEAFVQGEEKMLENFLSQAKKGSYASEVKNIEILPISSKVTYKEFIIL